MKNKEHKIFERFLNIDLDSFVKYLEEKNLQILTNTLPEDNELTDMLVKKYSIKSNIAGELNKKYNIFKFQNDDVSRLYKELMSSVKEACDYYGINFEEMDFRVRGWFNRDTKTEFNSHDPILNSRLFHDHLGGFGAPDFHGYYCVNAEPSSTYYKINNKELYENRNVNNKMILSENGHPHSRGDWNEESFRITIAYDVVPFQRLVEQGADKKSVWMKFK